MAFLLFFATSAFLPGHSPAQDLPQPSGRVLLTVDGSIDKTNFSGEARFDRDMLKNLDTTVLETESPWIEGGASTFVGTRISAILDMLGAHGNALTMTALDGYAVEIPISDIRTLDPMLSWERNGVTLTVRDRGPLWVTYPMAKIPEDEAAKYSARWIWQLSRITVHE